MADESDDRLAELDRLLNDPDVPMQAGRVWELLEQLATRPMFRTERPVTAS